MKKIIKILLIKLFLFTSIINAQVLEDTTININPEIIKQKYNLTDKYEKPIDLPSVEEKKEDDSSINLDVDIDKEQRQIDSLKLDVGKKF